jgi:phosphonate transport system substrate-binding protein
MTLTRKFSVAVVLLTALIAVSSFPPPTFADDELVIGVFPRRNATETIKMFTPLAEYLSRHLDRKVVLVTEKSFPAFWKAIKEQRYDIVHYNQYHYVKSHREQNYHVIARNVEFGSANIAGGILVRKDSNIESLPDVKNKKIVFGGGKKAMVSYIANTALLRRAGLPEGSYTEIFAKNPPNAALAVFHKHADAAGVGAGILKLPVIKSKVNTGELAFVGVTEPFAQLPWAVSGKLPTVLRNQIKSIFLTMDNNSKGRQVLKKAKITRFEDTQDEDYTIHREIIFEVLKEKY